MRTFFIKTKQTEGKAPLYVRVRKRVPSMDFFLNTHLDVDITSWNKCKTQSDYFKSAKALEKRLFEVDSAIDNALAEGKVDVEDFRVAVENVVFKEQKAAERKRKEQEEAEQRRIAANKAAEEAERNADVRLYIDNMIEGMRTGEVRISGKGRNKGEAYTTGSIKMYTNLRGIINRIYNEKPFTWDDIDQTFANRFANFMEREGYMKKSINKYISVFKAVIARAYEEKKHTNDRAAAYFSKTKVLESEKAHEIYLTSEELNGLYKMKLEGEKSIIRDVFLIGVYTCQRFSDYSRLKRENFTTTARGTKVVKLTQKKTKTDVVIPLLTDNLMKIAKKYNYNIPNVCDVVLNRYIKDICKELSETLPSLGEYYPTVLTMKEKALEEKAREEAESEGKEYVSLFKYDEEGRAIKPKYALVTSHTARRSGITNLYLSGKFDSVQMMSISGHKEAKTFREYIKLSGEQIAEGIADKLDKDLF